LHLVYFTPADREPLPRYRERLEAILEDIRAFYREGMERAGFGPKTFDLARDKEGKLVFHLVKGKEPEKAYPKPEGEKVTRECLPVLQAAGIDLESETVVIFCNLATWDEPAKTFRHHSPYAGMWSQENGLCWALDSAIQDLDFIPRKEPMLNDGEYGDMSLGRHNTIFIGGIAHELGHAFALPHCGERWDQKKLGTSLMGIGNHTYREERRSDGKGSFLAMASAMKLAARPLFNGSAKGLAEKPRLQSCKLTLSTNVYSPELVGRKGALRVEGTVQGTPAIYGVIAYFDTLRDGGYRAPTATAVPDAEGRFALEVSDLAPCGQGELRLEYCHVNGAVSEQRIPFGVTSERRLDLTQWETLQLLDPVMQAVAQHTTAPAQTALQSLERSAAPQLAKDIGRKLVASLNEASRLAPAAVPASVTEFFLGDARAQVAQVGWLKPTFNRVPLNNNQVSPLLDSGKLYATGIYAHAPARHVYDLGGKWKRLRGEAGLHTAHQPYGSVAFVIKTDGKEAFRSPVVRGDHHASYDVDLHEVKTLELVVEIADRGNANDWGLWLDPKLER
ncbi:MAG TPA: NPCBM/NEW2 domain-containing protein, partial [Bacillota bacterium]|nr:NPCBM/NEW2 domain-containing protein [Bacillota bacterium]